MKKNGKKKVLSSRQIRYIISTAFLVLCLVAMSAFFVLRMYFITEDNCYGDLKIETEDAIAEMEANIRNDRNMLRVLSGLIANTGDMDSIEVGGYLANYEVNNMIAKIGVLTPENEVIQGSGHKLNARGLMDFETESVQGEHVSNLQPSADNPNVKVIRNYVPIRQGGKCTGMLYSVCNPSNMAKAWLPNIYNGEASCLVVDRATGEVLINTSGNPIDNIDDLSFEQVSEEYSRNITIQNILNGRRGYSLFFSASSSEVQYMCFLPFDIEAWEMVIYVPESAVFEEVTPVRRGMIIMFTAIVLIIVIYCLWMASEAHQSVKETERKANVDVLTGLQNRNRYEEYLKELEETKEAVICIYIDANGLHELNNSRGHVAGDQMLRFIADTLKIEFGEEHLYRIGGDEFVVFYEGSSEKQMQDSLKIFRESLERNDYHAAIGLCASEKDLNVEYMVKKAEENMYEDKKKYYEKIGKEMRA